ncbi:hypothetical protein BOX15_Mlig031243g1 [Macrostomum lignano]|uniref:ADP-ribosylation factor-like protein 1 n=1 Tax=Macrostomum lignano TaxID=282301 RepID=A0A267H5G3_9PLAT|nr:hypothetical protein BOX15_Mlig031243g1 [Macrostomum lignano]
MGQAISSALLCRRTPDLRILIWGLDAAGKTSILYKLKTGELLFTIPTIGFNVEQLCIEGRANLTVWDIGQGGREKTRALYRHYYSNSRGVLYVVDGVERDRLGESVDELNRLCSELDDCELGDIPLALLCNKSDLKPQAVAETCNELRKVAASIRRPCRCFEVSAATGAGLAEAIDWLIASALHELPKELERESLPEQEGLDKVGEVSKAAELTAGSGWRSGLYSLVKSVMLR